MFNFRAPSLPLTHDKPITYGKYDIHWMSYVFPSLLMRLVDFDFFDFLPARIAVFTTVARGVLLDLHKHA